MNPFRRFNVWFDKLREPKRFLTFLALVIAWYAPLIAGDMLNNMTLRIIGAIGLILMVITALDRISLFGPQHRKPEDRQ